MPHLDLPTHSLYYSLSGSGPHKVLLIPGMGAYHTHWTPLINSLPTNQYTCLLFDNRGVGYSMGFIGENRDRLTTKALARDVVLLLSFLGWRDGINVVGESMGMCWCVIVL